MSAPAWTQGPPDPIRGPSMIEHLAKQGVFDEADKLVDRLDTDQEPSEVVRPAEVARRLTPYLR